MARQTFQVGGIGFAPRFGGGPGVGRPVVRQDVPGGQSCREGSVPALASQGEGARVAADARHGDGWMRLLQGLEYVPDPRRLIDVLFERELPEFAFVVVGRVRRPQFQDGVQRLQRHRPAILGMLAVELHVGADAVGAEAEVEPSLREVIQKCEPCGHVGRMVQIEAHGRGSQANAFGHSEYAADEHLGDHDGLEPHGVVLADPELVETELLRPDGQFHILVEALSQRLARRMVGHDENAGFDGSCGGCRVTCHASWSPLVDGAFGEWIRARRMLRSDCGVNLRRGIRSEKREGDRRAPMLIGSRSTKLNQE